MYAKRFIQLLVVYLISAALAIWLWSSWEGALGSFWAWLLAAISGYLVLTLPLVALTILKSRRKDLAIGPQARGGDLSDLLSKLPGYICFSWLSAEGSPSSSIMSWVQDENKDNVFYMVMDPKARKAQELTDGMQVSWTTYFDNISQGARVSSNQTKVDRMKHVTELVKSQPNILKMDENAVNKTIIKLTIHSALYEDFKDGTKIISF